MQLCPNPRHRMSWPGYLRPLFLWKAGISREWVSDGPADSLRSFPNRFPTELSHAGLFCLALTTWETAGISPARDALAGQQATRMERVGKSWGLLWRLRRAPGIGAHFYFVSKDPDSSCLGSRASHKSLAILWERDWCIHLIYSSKENTPNHSHLVFQNRTFHKIWRSQNQRKSLMNPDSQTQIRRENDIPFQNSQLQTWSYPSSEKESSAITAVSPIMDSDTC